MPYHEQLEMLANSFGIDNLLYDNDIDPVVVLKWLVDNKMIDADIYFEMEEDPNDNGPAYCEEH